MLSCHWEACSLVTGRRAPLTWRVERRSVVGALRNHLGWCTVGARGSGRFPVRTRTRARARAGPRLARLVRHQVLLHVSLPTTERSPAAAGSHNTTLHTRPATTRHCTRVQPVAESSQFQGTGTSRVDWIPVRGSYHSAASRFCTSQLITPV